MRTRILPLVLLALIALGATTPAQANAAWPDADIVTERSGSDVVTGQLLIPAARSTVLAAMAHIHASPPQGKRVLSERRFDAGPCSRIERTTRGMFSVLSMTSVRCQTDTGWRESLVQSDDFVAYDNAWSFREVDGGTVVEVRVRLVVDRGVPQKWINAGAARSMRRALARLAHLSVTGGEI